MVNSINICDCFMNSQRGRNPIRALRKLEQSGNCSTLINEFNPRDVFPWNFDADSASSTFHFAIGINPIKWVLLNFFLVLCFATWMIRFWAAMEKVYQKKSLIQKQVPFGHSHSLFNLDSSILTILGHSEQLSTKNFLAFNQFNSLKPTEKRGKTKENQEFPFAGREQSCEIEREERRKKNSASKSNLNFFLLPWEKKLNQEFSDEVSTGTIGQCSINSAKFVIQVWDLLDLNICLLCSIH